MKYHDKPDIIIPISLDLDWPQITDIVNVILEQHKKYGFTRYALACPCGGWRAISYPPSSFFEERAHWFAKIKAQLAPLGIECGWWITATVKSGLLKNASPIIRENGTPHPFANCPLDPVFRKRLAHDIALFAKIAKPSFIITEDDYAISSASAKGCFCQHHLEEFSRREGRYFTRATLEQELSSDTKKGYELLRRWRALACDTLVDISKEIRKAVDVESPEIPIGYMQAGSCDLDGDCTEAVSRALAGPNHTPFSRLCGAFYGGVRTQDIPSVLFHPFYSKQHIKQPFLYYHESDTFPHTRFFTSGREMLPLMSAAYSMGFDGSTFQTQQLLDAPNEECAYGKMFHKERPRMQALCKAVKHCRPVGAEICYDPFWNTVGIHNTRPHWVKTLSMFGIPWVTTESDIAFWDRCQAAHCSDKQILHYLKKPLLFLDGEAAHILCQRGFGKYLGVSMGEPVLFLPENSILRWDLGAREVIRNKYVRKNDGKNMPSAHMLANGNGEMLKMDITDSRCEVLTDMYTYDKRHVTPSMTCFNNSLGGTVVIMSITLLGNNSQSLLNYRRQRLIQNLIAEHCDKLVFVKEAPRIFAIMNEATDPEKAGFSNLLTLINLSSDPVTDAQLHLPESWRKAEKVLIMTCDGEWAPCSCTFVDDGVVLGETIDYLIPTYLMFI